MTPAAAWHPDEEALASYVDGTAGAVTAASVEAHVLSCRHCRAALLPAVSPARLAVVQGRIDDALDARERPLLERLLRRCRVREDDALVLLAAPSMRLAWWLSIAGALALAAVAERGEERAVRLFLLAAPLLPALSTAVAYAPGLDPAAAVVSATPYRSVRLLVVRTAVVSAVSFLLAAAGATALPGPDWATAAWVLPALGLTLAVLALSTVLDVGVATATVCGGWVAVVLATGREMADPLAAFHSTGQLLSAAVAVLALAVLIHQRDRLDVRSQT